MSLNQPEIHTAFRTLTDEQLGQVLKGTADLLQKGLIEQDLALEVMGIAIAHMLERSIAA